MVKNESRGRLKRLSGPRRYAVEQETTGEEGRFPVGWVFVRWNEGWSRMKKNVMSSVAEASRVGL